MVWPAPFEAAGMKDFASFFFTCINPYVWFFFFKELISGWCCMHSVSFWPCVGVTVVGRVLFIELVLQPQNITLSLCQRLSSALWGKRHSLRASLLLRVCLFNRSNNFKPNFTKYNLWTSTMLKSRPGESSSASLPPSHVSLPTSFPPRRGAKAWDFMSRRRGLSPKHPSRVFTEV